MKSPTDRDLMLDPFVARQLAELDGEVRRT
jgi:hypothetical protein